MFGKDLFYILSYKITSYRGGGYSNVSTDSGVPFLGYPFSEIAGWYIDR